MNGKGDRYRPVNQKAWDESYARIFGEKYARNSSQENKDESKNSMGGDTVQ